MNLPGYDDGDACRTEECDGKTDDGEGYDGYCGLGKSPTAANGAGPSASVNGRTSPATTQMLTTTSASVARAIEGWTTSVERKQVC